MTLSRSRESPKQSMTGGRAGGRWSRWKENGETQKRKTKERKVLDVKLKRGKLKISVYGTKDSMAEIFVQNTETLSDFLGIIFYPDPEGALTNKAKPPTWTDLVICLRSGSLSSSAHPGARCRLRSALGRL